MTSPTPDLAELLELPWRVWPPEERTTRPADTYDVLTASGAGEIFFGSLTFADASAIVAAVNALPALLDAAAERDALAAKVAEVLAIEPWPMKPATMQSYELDEGMGYNEARDEVRRILLDEEPQP